MSNESDDSRIESKDIRLKFEEFNEEGINPKGRRQELVARGDFSDFIGYWDKYLAEKVCILKDNKRVTDIPSLFTSGICQSTLAKDNNDQVQKDDLEQLIFNTNPDSVLDIELEDFNYKNYGISIEFADIDEKVYEESPFVKFYRWFCDVSVWEFFKSPNRNLSEFSKLPSTSYLKEALDTKDKHKYMNYMIYMLKYDSDCAEYHMMKVFLLMTCLLVNRNMDRTTALEKIANTMRMTDGWDFNSLYLRLNLMLPNAQVI